MLAPSAIDAMEKSGSKQTNNMTKAPVSHSVQNTGYLLSLSSIIPRTTVRAPGLRFQTGRSAQVSSLPTSRPRASLCSDKTLDHDRIPRLSGRQKKFKSPKRHLRTHDLDVVCENSRPIAAPICATSLAGPSRSSRAMSEACRLAGTANVEDGTAEVVFRASLSLSASRTALVISSIKRT